MTNSQIRPTNVNLEVVTVALLTGVNLLGRIYRFDFPPAMGGPLGPFRRTRTAWGIRSLMRDTINPFEMQLPIFGPPWLFPEEFPTYQWTAAMAGRLFGLKDYVAGRLVASVVFVLSGLVMYLLVRNVANRRIAMIGLVLYLYSPYGLYWGSDISIDYTAMMLCMASFWAFVTYLHEPRQWILCVGVTLGALGALTKLPTIVPWTIGLCIVFASAQPTPKRFAAFGLVGALVVAPALLWSAWAQVVKMDNPHTRFMTTDAMFSGYFGRLQDRVEMAPWQFLFRNIFDTNVGSALVALGLVTVAVARIGRHRSVVVASAITLSGPAIFSAPYWAHPYYPIAIMPALIFILAVGVDGLVGWIPEKLTPRLRAILSGLIVASLLALAGTSSEGTELMNGLLTRNRSFSLEFPEVTELTTSDDLILVAGGGWDPTFLYVVDRRGLMLRPSNEGGTRPTQSEIGSRYSYVYWVGEPPTDASWQEYFPYPIRYLALSPNLFKLKSGAEGT
jgi:hypothetical protein